MADHPTGTPAQPAGPAAGAIRNTDHRPACPWPTGVTLQGGARGVVYDRRDGSMRTTAFVEAWAATGTFVRGEGTTVADAEADCWARWQTVTACDHRYEPRGYRNGGGICARCGHFAADVFSAEDLGAHCRTCGTPTLWHRDTVDGHDVFSCPEHTPPTSTAAVLHELLGGDPIATLGEIADRVAGHDPGPDPDRP